MTQPISFPRQYARTRHYTLGRPRGFAVAPDGASVLFLRSAGGTDPLTALWRLDVATGEESLVVDARAVLGSGEEDLPPQERARRERSRETAGGVTAFSHDRTCSRVVVTLSGRLYVADAADAADAAASAAGPASAAGRPRELPAHGPVVAPQLDPTGRRVAYLSGRALRVVDVDGDDREVAGEADEQVSWGAAEFVAAEEMGRHTGTWWSPDGERLLAARVDDSPVQRWWISDPAHPGSAPTQVAYPRAGTPNADVTLALLGLDGDRTEVAWDRAAFPYLARVSWTAGGLVLLVQSRDQRTTRTLLVDPDSAAVRLLREDTDPHWVELVAGAPTLLADGRLVTTVDTEDTRRLVVGDDVVTPAGLQVLAVLDAGDDEVLLWATDDPTARQVWRWSAAGVERVSDAAGVHTATAAGGTTVLASAGLDADGTRTVVRPGSGSEVTIASYAETPVLTPRPRLLEAGPRAIRTAVLLPSDHRPGTRLPVLLDPYGGPHGPQVLQSRAAFHVAQWFADQGFAVVVADGRGMPARGPAWERSIAAGWSEAVLEDQVAALDAAVEAEPDLDASRVGIRGWSFGGYLAALAVLRRPDVFHAAVAGAPVTDMALYDTHYTERYLGTAPEGRDAQRYAAMSLLTDAPKLERPLLLVHGLADDNVVVAHTLRLSSALLEAGRPHTVLPLTGVTHMASQEEVAENLLLLQVEFLHRSLSRG